MNPMVKSVQSLMVLMFFILLLSVKAKAEINPENLVGEYLGTNNCAVMVELYGDDQLQFTIIRAHKADVTGVVPFYKLEGSESSSSFSVEKEVTGRTGQEKREVSGTVVAERLRNLTIRRVRSLFSVKSTSCDGLAPLMRYMP